MTEPKDPSESNEPEDPFAPGKTPPGWTPSGPGQSWEYQQPPPARWPQSGEPIGPPQEQIPPEGAPPYGQPPGYGQPPAGQWGPPPGQQWGAGAPQYGNFGEKPNNHLVWAILSTILCCLPLGVASIVFASRVNSRWNAGDVAGAQDASDKALKFAIASAVLGLLGTILIISLGGVEA